jgi:hypothetical protein
MGNVPRPQAETLHLLQMSDLVLGRYPGGLIGYIGGNTTRRMAIMPPWLAIKLPDEK